jgi:hypothetical protein
MPDRLKSNTARLRALERDAAPVEPYDVATLEADHDRVCALAAAVAALAGVSDDAADAVGRYVAHLFGTFEEWAVNGACHRFDRPMLLRVPAAVLMIASRLSPALRRRVLVHETLAVESFYWRPWLDNLARGCAELVMRIPADVPPDAMAAVVSDLAGWSGDRPGLLSGMVLVCSQCGTPRRYVRESRCSYCPSPAPAAVFEHHVEDDSYPWQAAAKSELESLP